MKDIGIHEKRMARNLLFMELLNLNMYIHQKSSKAKQDNKNMYSGSQCVSMASWILTVYPYIYIYLHVVQKIWSTHQFNAEINVEMKSLKDKLTPRKWYIEPFYSYMNTTGNKTLFFLKGKYLWTCIRKYVVKLCCYYTRKSLMCEYDYVYNYVEIEGCAYIAPEPVQSN